MSIRASFGIGTVLGFAAAALLGAPLAPAIVYGLLTGGVFAALAATPHGQRGIAVIHHRRPALFSSWSLGGPWFRRARPAHGVSVLPQGRVPVSPSVAAASGGSWFPGLSSFMGNSRTSASRTPMGGTSHHTASSVPAHASNVRVSSVRTVPSANVTRIRRGG